MELLLKHQAKKVWDTTIQILLNSKDLPKSLGLLPNSFLFCTYISNDIVKKECKIYKDQNLIVQKFNLKRFKPNYIKGRTHYLIIVEDKYDMDLIKDNWHAVCSRVIKEIGGRCIFVSDFNKIVNEKSARKKSIKKVSNYIYDTEENSIFGMSNEELE